MVIIGGRAGDAAQRPQREPLDHDAEHAGAQHGHDEREHQHADQRQAVEDWRLPDEARAACSIHMAMNEPTMKTLKWAKLISSMMP